MRRKLESINECLFSAFANPFYSDPQNRQQMWALLEALHRAASRTNGWRPVEARKDHKCMRDCKIKKGDVYFLQEVGVGWTDNWKFCASCLAMILYFKDVDKLPPVMYSHWDIEAKRPVLIRKAAPGDDDA